MENMIALTTPSETKLLREAGLIFVHPDCHVSMSGKVKKAALLKNLCTAASEGRLYYRDMRLYAYPEEPQQIRITIRYKGDAPVSAGLVPTGKRGHHTGAIQKRAEAMYRFVDSLPSGTQFRTQNIRDYLGVSQSTWQTTVTHHPSLKAFMAKYHVCSDRYFKP